MLTLWWRLSPLLFWSSAFLLAPLLWWQGRQARRDTPRLPEASGAAAGQWGDGAPGRRIMVLGESTAAGVGVTHHVEGLASQLARRLSHQDGVTTAWFTFGMNGARLEQVIAAAATADLPRADTVLLSMGVNDTTGFTSLSGYRRRLLALRALLQARYPTPLVLLSVPPMHRFTALPQPLRAMVGWRARQLDQVKKNLASAFPRAFCYIGYPAMTDPALLASDGYHPGGAGYRAVAGAIASALNKGGPSAP